MSPLVRIFKDVHIKIMTSQTQPVQGNRSIRNSFFTVPFQSPNGATGDGRMHQDRDAAPRAAPGL